MENVNYEVRKDNVSPRMESWMSQDKSGWDVESGCYSCFIQIICCEVNVYNLNLIKWIVGRTIVVQEYKTVIFMCVDWMGFTCTSNWNAPCRREVEESILL